MGTNYGYPQYMKRQLPKQAEPEASKPKLVIEGLPVEVLSAFRLEPTASSKKEGTWILTTSAGEICLKEENGDFSGLRERLKWQQFLVEQGGNFLPLLLRDAQGEPGTKIGNSYYYGWVQPEGKRFAGQNVQHLEKVITALSQLHELSRKYEQENQLPQDFLWPLQVQARLTDLLIFSRQLEGKRHEDDFQRVFMENIGFVYDQGQEAVQKMVLAKCTATCRAHFMNLAGNFLPENLLIGEERAFFCNLQTPHRGPRVLDLAVFLRSYLGQHHWDLDLVKNLLQRYQEATPLEATEKYLLLSVMRFPARFWHYTQQYRLGEKSVKDLTTKLINLVYESRLRDQCLDALDPLLIGGE